MTTEVTAIEKPFYLLGLNTPSIRFVAVAVITTTCFLAFKPNIFFDNRGNSKGFGTGQNETLFTWWMASVGLGTLSALFI